MGYFEFFYTNHLLDERFASLGDLPNDFGAAFLGVWAIGGLSHLSPETEQAFGEILRLLLKLYRRVFEMALQGAV